MSETETAAHVKETAAEPVVATPNGDAAEKTKTKRKRARKSGVLAAKRVREEMNSFEPIFYEKIIVRMIKKYSTEGTRVTPGVWRACRAYLEHNVVDILRLASKIMEARGGTKTRVMVGDVKLAIQIQRAQFLSQRA